MAREVLDLGDPQQLLEAGVGVDDRLRRSTSSTPSSIMQTAVS